MGRDAKNSTREIDDLTVEVFMLPPKQATKILTRLTKIIGEPLGFAAGALLAADGGDAGEDSGESDDGTPAPLGQREVPKDIVARILAAFTDRLEEELVWDTVEMLVRSTHIKGPNDNGTRQVRIEQDFRGKTLTMLKVAAFALEVNFQDFFDAVAGSGGGLLAKAQAAVGMTLARRASTGGSGGR